ncbi:MAG: hypothetical protein TEF_18650 [Rhizobiales bacterium NRL2]|jgi:ABC-type amino acid transport substrate-binding protein/ABC-type amino acid transport system permease subunit|nr:MAG: hypothetical protein TEF_18650 [Rhizobiales bacterium NRL2]
MASRPLPFIGGLTALLLLLWTAGGTAAADQRPDAALQALLSDARAQAARPGACADPAADALVRILCDGEIRIGARHHYPLFGEMTDGKYSGYDVDVGRAIAARLGVGVDYARVNAANRIPMLAEDRIDLIIATMGHNTPRDGQVRFVRPHYYRSETILVGPRELEVKDWTDIAGRSICVTIGNGSNQNMVSQGARLMLFDNAGALPERLQDGTCTLAAQDDSFFAYYFAQPAFAARYDVKFGFAQVPWGMAVARTGSQRLGDALDLVSQIFHRDGVFLRLAQENRIRTVFLEAQQAIWSSAACNHPAGNDDPACVLPALDAAIEPTEFAARVEAFEAWMKDRTGVALSLAMLKTKPAWTLFWSGVVNSLMLVAGALAATMAFALLIGAMFTARAAPLRWAARALTMVLQSSPIVLTLVIVATLAHALFAYSTAVALCATIVALGLANGCNAGQAISEAMRTLRAEGAADGGLFQRAVALSATQIVSFLVNATKGTPIAAFVGAPELLSALTDITSFASGRATTYGLLLVFYILVVMAVMWGCGRLRLWLERRQAAA